MRVFECNVMDAFESNVMHALQRHDGCIATPWMRATP
jgi:hypothetical protein